MNHMLVLIPWNKVSVRIKKPQASQRRDSEQHCILFFMNMNQKKKKKINGDIHVVTEVINLN